MRTDGLPTGRGLSRRRLIVWCKTYRHQRELPSADIVAMRKAICRSSI